ncbi:MAG: DUF4738 domain-containing protein [Prevotella sp.]|nr:DUF4738 domain-containing protein [Prevotella sp.]
MRKAFIAIMVILVTGQFSSCQKKGSAGKEDAVQEDTVAKQMLQGIWVDEDGQDVAFKAQGDSIFYPDSTSQPVRFQIFGDTLVLHSASDVKYPILKQTKNLFIFRNQNGDEVKLVLSEDANDADFFLSKRPQALNQGVLIKRDTVVKFQDKPYHCYIQVNPTTYKVIKSSWNDEGVEVDNVYYDNIINLNVYSGARRLFHSDIKKQQFSGVVPADFLNQSVFSDLILKSVDAEGIHFQASLVMPDETMNSFQVMVTISYNGHMSMNVRK